MASVIHQIAIHIVDAKTALACGFNPSGRKKSKMNINAKGPEIRPIFFEFMVIFRV